MEELKVGDLVRDKLNEGDGAYGLGVVVATDRQQWPVRRRGPHVGQ